MQVLQPQHLATPQGDLAQVLQQRGLALHQPQWVLQQRGQAPSQPRWVLLLQELLQQGAHLLQEKVQLQWARLQGCVRLLQE